MNAPPRALTSGSLQRLHICSNSCCCCGWLRWFKDLDEYDKAEPIVGMNFVQYDFKAIEKIHCT